MGKRWLRLLYTVGSILVSDVSFFLIVVRRTLALIGFKKSDGGNQNERSKHICGIFFKVNTIFDVIAIIVYKRLFILFTFYTIDYFDCVLYAFIIVSYDIFILQLL